LGNVLSSQIPSQTPNGHGETYLTSYDEAQRVVDAMQQRDAK